MTLKLVSFSLCPFVQRAVITLKEKQVDFELQYIDLESPPDWFKRLSPLGKVPLLQVGEEVLFESAVIIDYLDEVFQPRLHPGDPLKRAQHRAWIEYGSGLLLDQHAICIAKDRLEYQAKVEKFRQNLARVASPLEKGLFESDSGFTLVDAAYAPLFMRMAILNDLGSDGWDRYPQSIAKWAICLLQRPSVAASVIGGFAEKYVTHFAQQGSWLMGQSKV